MWSWPTSDPHTAHARHALRAADTPVFLAPRYRAARRPAGREYRVLCAKVVTAIPIIGPLIPRLRANPRDRRDRNLNVRLPWRRALSQGRRLKERAREQNRRDRGNTDLHARYSPSFPDWQQLLAPLCSRKVFAFRCKTDAPARNVRLVQRSRLACSVPTNRRTKPRGGG